MKNDKLTQTWNRQKNVPPLANPDHIIKKAKKQRSKQFIAIAAMSITVLTLLIYSIYYSSNQWNNFTLGLVLMISSLTFRIILEFVSLYRKESQVISLDNLSFKKYLKRHYKIRSKVNYIITPICFAIYIFGFTRLLPYFEQELSKGFYTYILISGIVSLFVIAIIIVNSILKESHFLNQLNRK
ncbi:hypothetical protein [Flavivirga eckloniae]|uniref:DUF3278 domain-containing protein n=1 Tax=Flavivirga eckloniae TaxID=1803846 RepID=A0A2K9PQY2_9FLAO|nr:hypothetical protein [Flavivirga eckloniae]AUP79464.1 hypothetical protein C1H87_12405 [Flavivirga eckloniae]